MPDLSRCSCVCAQPLGHSGACDNADAIRAREQRERETVALRAGPIEGAPFPDKLPAHGLAPLDEASPSSVGLSRGAG